MRLFLQPDVQLVPDSDGPILYRNGISLQHRLTIGEALALSVLGATGDPGVAEAYCTACLGDEIGKQWTRRAIDRYWTYLGDGPARPLSFEWLKELQQTDGLAAVPQREAAPAAVTWLVTLGCPRRCPYCFYTVAHHPLSHTSSPPDATFPLPDALRLVREMGRIGTADLYLTGGEPLLRKDLPSIIQAASAARVRTHLITKYPIDSRLAAQLSEAGLCSATVSLDDARAAQAAALAGAPGYLEEATRAVRSLLAAGIPVEINAVATRINIEHLDLLVDLALSLAVPKLSISPFIPPPWRSRAARLLPTAADLVAIFERLRQRYGHLIALELRGPTAEQADTEERAGSRTVCEVGKRTLHILPDGHVTRCHYLPANPDLVVGSLQRQTLLEIWTGASLAALCNPERPVYAGTACSSCDAFTRCNARGRCYLAAFTRANRLYAPDTYCLREDR
jgi:pyrroloquinoline quinone biosynthesis protein E